MENEEEFIDKLKEIAEGFGKEYLWYLEEIMQEYRAINSFDRRQDENSKICIFYKYRKCVNLHIATISCIGKNIDCKFYDINKDEVTGGCDGK